MYRLSRAVLIVTIGMWALSICILTLKLSPKMIVLLCVCGVGLWFKRREKPLTTLGSARWATAKDLRGMLDTGRGLSVGKLLGARCSLSTGIAALLNKDVEPREACNQFLRALRKRSEPVVRLTNAVHIAIFGSTGSGKGVSFAIPHLLESSDSCVALDIKGELALATAKHREEHFGHQVVIIDPFDVVCSKLGRKSDTFNPLDLVQKGARHLIDECMALGEALVVRTGEEKEPHWSESAVIRIGGAIAAVSELGEENRSLQAVSDILSSKEKMDAVGTLMMQSTTHDGMLARIGHQLLQYQGDELASVMTTTNRHLRFLNTPTVADSTRRSSFDPAKLRDGKMTIYVVVPPNHLTTLIPFVRMCFSSFMRIIVRGGSQEKNLVTILLDEAAAIGHLSCIEEAVGLLRGFGLRLIFVFQSIGQLKKCFPAEGDQTFLANVSQIYLSISDLQTAEYVSNRIGEETIVVNSGGWSGGTSDQHSGHGPSHSHSANENQNWSQQARKLIKPDEIMALNPRIALTFSPGVRPICTWLTRYYEKNERPFGWFRTFMAACFWFAVSFIAVVAVTAA